MTNKKKRKISPVLLLVFTLTLSILFSINSAQATIKFNNLSLPSTNLGPGQAIDAQVNLNLTDQLSNAKVEILVSGADYSQKATMSLLEFLNKLNLPKTCNPADCLTTYSASNPETSKTKILDAGQEVLLGTILNNNNVEIQNFSFVLQGKGSSAEKSCSDSIIKLDILDKNSVDWEYSGSAEAYCNDFYTDCYSSSAQEILLDSNPRCERIMINKTGKVSIGAFIKHSSGNAGSSDIILQLYDIKNSKTYFCNTTVPDLESQNYQVASCEIDQENNPGFFIDSSRYVYVCAFKNPVVTSNYSIKYETQQPLCGFYGQISNQPTFNSDYSLYIKTGGFSPMSEDPEQAITIDNSTITELVTNLQNYINRIYNKNCQPNNCVIPFRILASQNQAFEINSLNLNYNSSLGSRTQTNIYDIASNYAKINLAQQFSIASLNLTAPEVQGTYTLKVTIGSSMKTVNFNIAQVPIPISITPSFVIPGKQALFHVNVQTVGNQITEYQWSWGDGSQDTTQIPEANHTYSSNGTYNLAITVKDSIGISGSKTFQINSSLNPDSLNSTIINLKRRMENISQSISMLEDWYISLFYAQVNLTNLNATLNSQESNLNSQNPDLTTINEQLTQLDSQIPLAIINTLSLQSSPYVSDKAEIDPGLIQDMGGGTFKTNEKEELTNKIALWQDNNLKIMLAANVKAARYTDKDQEFATTLSISIEPKTEQDEIYLILKLPSGINPEDVKSNQNFESLDHAIGINTSLSSEKTFEFAFPGKQDFNSINFFASPSLNTLKSTGTQTPKNKKSMLAIFLAIIIVIIVLVGIFLIWNKKNPSAGLFKNENDIIGLINFITINLARGTERKQIEEQLLNTGWNKKQINYAFKQIQGDKGKTGNTFPGLEGLDYNPKFK